MAVIACRDAPPVFQSAEQAFNDIAALVDFLIEWVWCAPRGCGWDGRLDLLPFEPVAQTVSIIGLIGEQSLGLPHGAEKRNSHGDIGDISRRQGEGDRSATIIGQSMDFARSSAARAANRFRVLPLFEPAAERCALT